MSNSILIRNINNLTDARYFAAMGVDWMSIKLSEDPGSFLRWHTMREWQSGVKLAAEIKTMDEFLVAKAIIDANPDGIVFDDLTYIHMTGGIELFILTEKLLQRNPGHLFSQILVYDSLSTHPEIFLPDLAEFIYLEADWTPELIMQLHNEGYSGGFCFEGSDEKIVGVRDYSQMDKMLELLQI